MIAAGGTGGHVFPGVAIAMEIRKSRPGVRVVFAGTSRGIEERIVPPLGWKLIIVNSTKIKGKSGFGKLVSLMRTPFSIMNSIGIIRSEKPALIVSVGGYAAGPLSLAAWFLGVPVVLLEPNAVPGLTNRVLGRFAKMVFIAFDGASAYFNSKKIVKTGTPIRKEILNSRRREIMTDDKFTIFLFGGSQGARRLNESMVDAVKKLADYRDRIRVFHQTGRRENIDEIKASYAASGIDARVFDFTDRIWECYAKADFVIARAGASTVSELAALSLPSVLVPYPHAADDHQRANAEELVHVGGALMIRDDECTGDRLATIIREMIEDPDILMNMRKALIGAGPHDAAKKIVEESFKLIG